MDAEATRWCEVVGVANADHCEDDEEWLLAVDAVVVEELVEETSDGEEEVGGEDMGKCIDDGLAGASE